VVLIGSLWFVLPLARRLKAPPPDETAADR